MELTKQVLCPMDWCNTEEDVKSYKCHDCHDGLMIEELCPKDEWEEVYMHKDGFMFEQTIMYKCKKCETEYYDNFYEGDGSVGGSSYKYDKDGKRYEFWDGWKRDE